MGAMDESLRFLIDQRRAALRHSGFGSPDGLARKAVRDLRLNGYCVLRDVVDRSALLRVRSEADAAWGDGRIVPARVRKPLREQEADAGEMARLRELMTRGEEELAREESMIYVADPLMNCSSASSVLFSDIVLRIAQGYYGCPTGLISPKVVKSYPNDLPESSANRFHADYQHTRFLKFFVYLTDVPTVAEGPFCFVAGSHRRKPYRWRRHPLTWTRREMAGFYGDAAIRVLTGRTGDLIAADTRGFHRGVKPTSRSRTMLKVSTGLRPWAGAAAAIPASEMARLTPQGRAAARYLRVDPSA
ncbi:phytanoyl-CoA dioxygenase family protein [Streptomyces sp. NPDC051913]|uniref:phytanoyl-CoA dioxygenase family protein n=1 Tax=Streptomyces sp. NPDC051913 TaxID=3365676 RepID=UPI0037D53B51